MTASLPNVVCPTHGTALNVTNERLECRSGCTFAVRDGIARFVPPSNYAAAFGLQWNRYRRTQLDSYTGTRLTEQRLRRCLGDDLWGQLPRKNVLEVGCGAGRFTEVLLAQGANVFSTDLSEAVTANRDNFPQSENHEVAQADVYSLPFAKGQFDIVVCLGVVQHTPSPEKTMSALWSQVAPNGWLIIDHYTYNVSYFTKTAAIVRPILKRLSPERALRITDGLVDALLPLHKAVRSYYPLQAILSRLSPVQAYYHSLPELNDQQQREWALLDTHDTLTDWYKHFRSKAQIERFLQSLGAMQVWCHKGGNGVEARAMKPATNG